jgi:hypothetical protein
MDQEVQMELLLKLKEQALVMIKQLSDIQRSMEFHLKSKYSYTNARQLLTLKKIWSW